MRFYSKCCSHESCMARARLSLGVYSNWPPAAINMLRISWQRLSVRDAPCDSCTKFPSCKFEGSKPTAYCKQHAKSGLADTHGQSCATFPARGCYQHETGVPQAAEDGIMSVQHRLSMHYSSMKAYCKQHARSSLVDIHCQSCAPVPARGCYQHETGVPQAAEDGIVSVQHRLSMHYSSMKVPSFCFESSKLTKYRKQHATNVISCTSAATVAHMILVGCKRTSSSRGKNPHCTASNMLRMACWASTARGILMTPDLKGRTITSRKGSRGVPSERHMFYVSSNRFSHESCRTQADFNFKGKKPALYCKQHVEDGMLGVNCERYTYDS